MLRLEVSSDEIRAWASEISETDDTADALRISSSDSREVRACSRSNRSQGAANDPVMRPYFLLQALVVNLRLFWTPSQEKL